MTGTTPPAARMTRMIRLLVIAAPVLVFLSGPALAEKQTYTMSLGARQIGTLVFDGAGRNARLVSTMDNTPLGVADGTFEATTRGTGSKVAYLSKNRGSKVRDIAVTRQGQKVTAVSVTPAKEKTDMTDPAKVPDGVISPTEVFARLATGTHCPQPMAIYDGRRVVQMATASIATDDGAVVTCDMSYRVVMGPGHLSPFRFKSLGMQVVYAAGVLDRVTMSAGGFDVTLTRNK